LTKTESPRIGEFIHRHSAVKTADTGVPWFL